MSIGSRIKEKRIAMGITQSVLAEKIGLSLDYVRSLEIDRKYPSVDTLEKLSKVFDCTTDYLLGNADNYIDTLIRLYRDLPDDKKKIIDDLILNLKDPQ